MVEKRAGSSDCPLRNATAVEGWVAIMSRIGTSSGTVRPPETDRPAGVAWPSGIARPSVEAVALWGGLALVLWLVAYATLPNLGRHYDFRTFYAAGELVRQAPSQLYDLRAQDALQNAVANPHQALPFYHPAYEALLFVPLSLLSYRGAYFVFLGLNLLALGACYLIAPLDGVLERWRAGVVFLFAPVLISLLFGQDSILFLLLLCVVWRLLRSDRDAAAGVVLALALFKLGVVPIIAILLCTRRGRRFTAGFCTTAVALSIICLWITGVSGAVEFVRLLMRDGSAVALNVPAAFPALMPTLHGLFYVTLGHLLSLKAFLFMYCALWAGLLAVGMMVVRRATELSVAFCTAIVCGVLLSPHLFGYDFAALLLPMMLLKNRVHAAVACGCFAAALLLMSPLAVRFAEWAVVLPVAMLMECVADSGLLVRANSVSRSESVMMPGEFSEG